MRNLAFNEPGTPDADLSMMGDDLPIDFDHLQRFTLGNRCLEREVLTLFRTQARTCIDRLRQAEDDKAWHEAAHTLKGSAAGIGAWAVQEAAREAERLTGSERQSGGEVAIAGLETAVGQTDVFIAQFLNE